MKRCHILARAVASLLLAALLFACSGSPSGRVYPDPKLYPIRGIDISAHNGEVDYELVREAGIQFVIIKATEGATFKDRRFVENIRNAREAGLKVGVYHFFRFDTPGYMQSLNLLHSLRGRQVDLPVAIDIEEWTNPAYSTTGVVLGRLTEMIDHLEANGLRVMLYTNKNGHTRFIRNRLESYPLWICSLADEPTQTECVLWQATHNGRIPGIDHPVDVNAFMGTAAEWERFAGTAQ